MANKLWAGLDIGAETTSVCVIDDVGEVLHEASCATDLECVCRELRCLKRRRFARIGLESGVGSHLARGLRKRGYSVDIYEARQLSKFLRMRRNKTDAGDANGIAQAGRLAAPLVSKVHLKSFENQSLASRLVLRRFLVRTRNRAYTLLCRQIELFGGRLKSHVRSPALIEEVDRQLRKLFGRAPDPLAEDIRRLMRDVEALLARQKALDKELGLLAMDNEVCRRLMDIPGIGPICALTFFAAIDEPHRFRKASAVGSYLGLTPRIVQSGLYNRTGRISRMGHRDVRHLLVRASVRFMSCTKPELALHAWTSNVEQRRGRGKSRVALARKLATIMVAIWKSGRSYQPMFVEAAA